MNEVMKILQYAGAIVGNSHFVGTSGRHFDTYFNKDALFPHPDLVSKIGKIIALKYYKRNIDIVAAPALGGIILAQWTAYHLSKLKKKKILAIYTEKDTSGNQVLRRGFGALVKNKKVLVLEDLTTTGGSLRKVIKTIKQAQGKVVAACAMVNRDPERVSSKSVGVAFTACAVSRVVSYTPAQCPLCRKSIPINTSLGHGKIFLKQSQS